MSKSLACNYSVLRFAPYPETDEFVNVGVVLACPALGYLDFRLADPLQHERVALFFPELDTAVYSSAMRAWAEALNAHRSTPSTPQTGTEDALQRRRELFTTLVRPRESILYYSGVRVILGDNPATTLEQVFTAFVERHMKARIAPGASAGR